MGVEVGTGRTWHRGEDGHVARVVVVNMLDRERADFFRVLEALRSQASTTRCVAVHIPIGVEHELTGIVDVLHMCAYTSRRARREAGASRSRQSSPTRRPSTARSSSTRSSEPTRGLMERYLDGQELSEEEVATALKKAVARGEVFPVAAAVATKNLGTTALLDLLVEGVPGPDERDAPFEVEGANIAAFVFKTIADPFAGRINVFRVLKGTITTDTTLTDTREHAKERHREPC